MAEAAIALPEALLQRWDKQHKAGLAALQWYASLCANNVEIDVRALQQLDHARAQLAAAAEALQALSDELHGWLRIQRRACAPGLVHEAVVVALGAQVELFAHEASVRHHVSATLSEDGARAALLAWKARPFLSGTAMQRAQEALDVAVALAERAEVEQRHKRA